MDGIEFLGYARQIVEQTELLENHYKGTQLRPVQFFYFNSALCFCSRCFCKVNEKF